MNKTHSNIEKQVLISLALSIGLAWDGAHLFAHANADILNSSIAHLRSG